MEAKQLRWLQRIWCPASSLQQTSLVVTRCLAELYCALSGTSMDTGGGNIGHTPPTRRRIVEAVTPPPLLTLSCPNPEFQNSVAWT